MPARTEYALIFFNSIACDFASIAAKWQWHLILEIFFYIHYFAFPFKTKTKQGTLSQTKEMESRYASFDSF